jgi:NitT/TauT family transport system permease protein
MASILVVLGAWQLSGVFLPPVYLSTPSRVAVGFFEVLASGSLQPAFVLSLGELVIGVGISVIVGVGLGLIMGRIRAFDRALNSLVAFGNATPTIAVLPLMEVWFGFGSSARVSFIIAVSIWPLIINTLAGVHNLRPGFRDLGTSVGMTPWTQTWRIYVPGSMGYILAGARIAFALGIIGMVLAGQEIGQSGLGGLAETYGTFFQTDRLVPVVLTSTGLAALLFGVLRMVQFMFFPWIRATAGGRRS